MNISQPTDTQFFVSRILKKKNQNLQGKEAEEAAQAVKCLFCKYRDLSFIRNQSGGVQAGVVGCREE